MTNFDLARYLDLLLDVRSFNDASYNGLQVQGRDEIEYVVTAASASQQVIEQAVDMGADCLLVHHGLFWKGDEMRIVGSLKKRLETIITFGLNLMAYHLPLDAHPELGNNRFLCDLIGGVSHEYLEPGRPQAVAMLTELPAPAATEELGAKLRDGLGSDIEIIAGKEQQLRWIRTVAVCSGEGSFVLDRAREVAFDALITGEAHEQTYHLAIENRVPVFVCGHHASEQDGVRLLGERLARDYPLQVEHLRSNPHSSSLFMRVEK